MGIVSISLFLIHGQQIVNATGVQAQATMIKVNGTVLNGEGQPLQLEFDFLNGTNINQEITSSSTGQYNYMLPKGNWDWKFASVNQQPDMPRFFEVEKQFNLASNDSETLIPDVFTITGKLTDSNNNALSGAKVDSGVCPIVAGSFSGTQEDVVTTNSTGYYTLRLLPSTCDSLKIVTQTGFTFFPNSGRIITVNNNMTDNISLAVPITISGTTTDPNNNPVSMTVQLVGTDFVESSTSNSSGHYSFNIPTGPYTLKYSQNGIISGIPRFYDLEEFVNANSNLSQNIKLNVTSVSGTSPFTSATIDVRNPIANSEFNGFSSDRITTDSSGHFTANLLQSTSSTVTILNKANEQTVTCFLSGGNITC